MSAAAGKNYLRDSILQATPEQLQLMLYDGAIKFALKGRDAIEKKDFEGIYENISRAQKIVLEMEAGLRPEVNREVCQSLSALYHFVYRKLIDASVGRDVSAVDDAVKILRHQRETWVMLMNKVAQVRSDIQVGPGNSRATTEAATSQLASLCVEG